MLATLWQTLRKQETVTQTTAVVGHSQASLCNQSTAASPPPLLTSTHTMGCSGSSPTSLEKASGEQKSSGDVQVAAALRSKRRGIFTNTVVDETKYVVGATTTTVANGNQAVQQHPPRVSLCSYPLAALHALRPLSTLPGTSRRLSQRTRTLHVLLVRH